MKQVTISLIKVKSCYILLSMLMECIHSYLKQVLRYKFLILDTYYPDTICMSKDVRICAYFSKPKGVCQQKSLGNTGVELSTLSPSGLISTCTPCSTSPTKVKMSYMYIMWIVLHSYNGVSSTVISTCILLMITFRTKWMYPHMQFGLPLHLVR